MKRTLCISFSLLLLVILLATSTFSAFAESNVFGSTITEAPAGDLSASTLIAGILGFFLAAFFYLSLIFLGVLFVVACCKMYAKAGERGWTALVPYYNLYVLFKITFGCGWWFLFLFVPFVNIVATLMTYYRLARVFGKGIGFTLGLIFLPFVFIPVLAFGSSIYVGNQRPPYHI